MRIVVVLKGYPRLSETFIAQELEALEARGFELVIVALRRPTEEARHPVHDRIRAPVAYLPEYLRDEPRRVLRALGRALARPSFGRLLRLFWRDLARDATRNRARRLGQALVLASEILRPGDLVYAHFLHTPGSVARYAARLASLPFGFSAHAKDIWTIPDWEKREKLADARFAVTCTRAGAEHLSSLAPEGRAVELLYHGLDLARLPAPPARVSEPAVLEVLCVARAVPKKGLDVLIEALAALPIDRAWRLVHIGGGDTTSLRALCERLGVAGRVTFEGACAAPRVFEAYARADLFVLASRTAADGDRDGVPNVLMEAMSQELPVIATRAGAIEELVEDGVQGLLVPPDDAPALTSALAKVMGDAALRRRLGAAGRVRVARDFTLERGIDRLTVLLGGDAAARAA